MGKSDGAPEVFGDGDVTIIMNERQARLFIGTVRVEFLGTTELEIGPDGQGVSLTISFPKSPDAEIARKIEENARTVRAFPWIRVLR